MAETAAAFGQALMLAVVALLPILNPPGSAPIFLSLTRGTSEAGRTALARRVARNSFVLLVAAMLVGSYVLIFFGLSLPVIKIAGGLLLIATAWQLISADHGPDVGPEMTAEPSNAPPENFYPLTFPLTVGPGSISVAVTIGADARTPDVANLVAVLGTVAGIALVSIAIYFCYRFAARLIRALGTSGTVVLMRLSAFILLSVGVQIFCDGVVERFAAGLA
jgi:multiple antibiotic resistance protein